MVTLVLNNLGHGAVFTAKPVDKDGQPTVPTSEAWSVSNPAVLLIQTPWGGDPLKAHVEPLGLGNSAVAFACPGDPDTISASDTVTVIPPPAGPPVSVTLEAEVD